MVMLVIIFMKGKIIKMVNETGHFLTTGKEQMQTYKWFNKQKLIDKKVMKKPIVKYE